MTVDKWFLLWMNSVLLFAICRADLTVEKIDDETNSLVLTRTETDDGVKFVPEAHSVQKREAFFQANITSYVTRLNSSHHKLNVHWSGTSSQVLICLAQTSRPLGIHQKPLPSSLYISYDYGKTFENKTDFFKLSNDSYASPDKCFFPKNAESFLRITEDFGENFVILQESVKSYVWTNKTYGPQDPLSVALIVQRLEPHTMTAIMLTNIKSNRFSLKPMLGNVEKISSHGDFVFALRKTGNVSEKFEYYCTLKFPLGFCKSPFLAGNQATLHFLPRWRIPADSVRLSNDPQKFPRRRHVRCSTYGRCHLHGNAFQPVHIRIRIRVRKILFPSQPRAAVRFSPECDLARFLDQKKNCSLHVTQKFSMLYPATRNTPILSSDSAPGIIMATGTVGSSLKGHNGVYISRDAGLSWHHVMLDFLKITISELPVLRFCNIFHRITDFLSGPQGKLYFQHRRPRRHTNGRPYVQKCRRNFSSPVFVRRGRLLGSVQLRRQPDAHLRFDDRAWRKHNRIHTFRLQARIARMDDNQYRFSKRIPDYGFVRHLSSPVCGRNFSPEYDPYKIPFSCQPGQFYERTRGYRKIDGDACIGGNEADYMPELIPCPTEEPSYFLLLAQKEHIIRFDVLNPKPQVLPVRNLNNVISIDYDIENNCVYFADIVDDVIGRQCFASGNRSVEYLVTSNLRSVEGIAFDWVSRSLYFVDGVRAKIELIRTDIDHSGRMRMTILDSKAVKKPRGIALHPVKGYMFWTDWDKENPTVNRANMDGGDIRILAKSPRVHWPNGITIDHFGGHIYWADARLDYIATTDLEGRFFRIVASNKEIPSMKHPFSVAVFKDILYWDDWSQREIFMINKNDGSELGNIQTSYVGLMDVKQKRNACRLSSSAITATASAEDGSATWKTIARTARTSGTARPGRRPLLQPIPLHALCEISHRCIMKAYVCDGSLDCGVGDDSDERNCTKPNASSENNPPTYNSTCKGFMFKCSNKICVPDWWKCDGVDDCGDNSDEEGCVIPPTLPSPTILPTPARERKCRMDEFRCDSGACIAQQWVCDSEKDCPNGEDEKHCDYGTHEEECPPRFYKCKKSRTCLPAYQVCDGIKHCPDGSDEIFCNSIPKGNDFMVEGYVRRA
ncbi:unnamed protein product [Nesidiocoris tenuis]|uniref:VPS10 domain-containing protein n=1 Tax=Nesidiocoris tenuis TaxID=355587 RepID=A0A6H5FXV9_9HEMI|nr:unnamed protein product [Nesidiocoris tenuis]